MVIKKAIISIVIFLILFLAAWFMNLSTNHILFSDWEENISTDRSVQLIPLTTYTNETQPSLKKKLLYGPREYVKFRKKQVNNRTLETAE